MSLGNTDTYGLDIMHPYPIGVKTNGERFNHSKLVELNYNDL